MSPAVRLVIALAAVAVDRIGAQPATTGFLDRAVVIRGDTNRFQVYVPSGFVRGREWPVVLYLHACCPNGVDGMRHTNTGFASVIRERRADFPVIAVFPQARTGHRWDSTMTAMAITALEAATREFSGDRERTYLLGFSMGGRGVWSLLAREPSRFAAAVVVAGPVVWTPASWTAEQRQAALRENAFLTAQDPFASLAAAIRNVPIRLYHGLADSTAPIDDARSMWHALEKENKDARFIEFEGGHDDVPVLANIELWTWLFSKRRR